MTTDVLSCFGEKWQEAVKLCQSIINICQLHICIKSVDANLYCFEEMFEVVSLHGHVAGQALFDTIDSKVFSIVDKNKLASNCARR